ncbi:MAG: hypothetical protein LBS90_03360, partial [Oscillospiraceae bacterium]|nr:hypothetical protein [Oscillospiraceae bacterium]
MKRYTAIPLALILAFALSACGGKAETEVSRAPQSSPTATATTAQPSVEPSPEPSVEPSPTAEATASESSAAPAAVVTTTPNAAPASTPQTTAAPKPTPTGNPLPSAAVSADEQGILSGDEIQKAKDKALSYYSSGSVIGGKTVLEINQITDTDSYINSDYFSGDYNYIIGFDVKVDNSGILRKIILAKDNLDADWEVIN